MFDSKSTNTLNDATTIVIGSGPVGVRFVDEFRKRQAEAKVLLFGDEPVAPYNRVQLSALLAGEVSVDDIELSLPTSSERFEFIPRKIVDLNLEKRTVVDAAGDTHEYTHLVLALGARPHIPNIRGIDQIGVFTFRNLRDAEHLYARTSRSKHTVIVGGGLLGIETAKGLLKNNTRITLVQQGTHLMNKQLDVLAATILQTRLHALGVRVIANTGVRSLTGNGRVTGVALRSREWLECDTVVFCSGVSPNIEIARTAGLRVARGIVVNEQMQTSASDVYAIGECCEFARRTYGIVNPGYEQAAVLADILSGGKSVYKGSLPSSTLKVIGLPVRSFGSVVNYLKTPFHRELIFQQPAEGVYRKIVVERGRPVGGIIVGDWEDSARLVESYQQKRPVNILRRLLFRFFGRIWPGSRQASIQDWPGSAVVCQCNGVTLASLRSAMDNGQQTVCALAETTRASSACGSCRPLLQELLANRSGVSVQRETEWAWHFVLLACVVAFGAAITVLTVPALAIGHSVTQPSLLELFWNNKFWKQVSGFTLLGLSVVGLLVSLRKRFDLSRLGKFAYWRFAHIVIGTSCALILILHTGLSIGHNFNRWLMLNFLMVLILGAMAGSVTALSHRLKPAGAQTARKVWSKLHLLVTWPLPVLLGIHILTVYFF